jgi:hypothetical protein
MQRMIVVEAKILAKPEDKRLFGVVGQ